MEPPPWRRVMNASYCSPADKRSPPPPPLLSLSSCHIYLSSPASSSPPPPLHSGCDQRVTSFSSRLPLSSTRPPFQPFLFFFALTSPSPLCFANCQFPPLLSRYHRLHPPVSVAPARVDLERSTLPPLPVSSPPLPSSSLKERSHWCHVVFTCAIRGRCANRQPASPFIRCSEALGQAPPLNLCSSQWQEGSHFLVWSSVRFKEPPDD